MKILLAETAGFCMGVRRAVELAMAAPAKYPGPIYTYGPLIHNPQVLRILSEKGISILEHIPEKGEGTVIIRAHGVPPRDKQAIEKAGFSIIDATCPRVIRVQSIIAAHNRKGYSVFIAGDRKHPEVVGLVGFAEENAYIIETIQEIESLPPSEKAILVAQTTQHASLYNEMKERLKEIYPQMRVFDTICDSTHKRQEEVASLAQKVDAMVVVGGKTSGNTKRLAMIAMETGKPSFHIETEDQLLKIPVENFESIGITAGASTPNWVINQVHQQISERLTGREKPLKKLARNTARILLLTNIYVALGAGSLGLACSRLAGITRSGHHLLIAMLYILSMHTLNRLMENKADVFNSPQRAAFYRRNRRLLLATAMIAGAGGLFTAFLDGTTSFFILLAMSLLGLTYNISFIPKNLSSFRHRRLRDIPGSKTVLIALAWGTVTVLLPALSEGRTGETAVWLTFFWSTGIVFARTTFFDVLDIQGDRMVGKETVPLLIGEKRAIILIEAILAALTLYLLLLFYLGAVSNIMPLLTLSPIGLLMVTRSYSRGTFSPGIRPEFLVESMILSTGILSLAGWPVPG